jgi:ABC-type multidrug transport system ATPase subunit
MGASGAGKTTFLDILARKNKVGATGGDFYLNGEKIRDDEFKSVIGFVDQDDTLLPTLTVHETILDSALLRLPKEMSRASKEQRVEDVERQLGIYHIRNQKIGSEETGRGISGGEKRRVGIACELVTSPSILFLDEPTSGLDSFNAFNVVECLVNGRGHYPSAAVKHRRSFRPTRSLSKGQDCLLWTFRKLPDLL